jgi:hypothetical protein
MYRCVVLLSLLFLTLLPTGQSALVEEADVQHLSCVADNDCRLTTYPIGEETVGGQVQGTPFAPAEVVLEFIIDPAQDVLVLLPSVLDHVELDLRLDDDPTRLSWPTLDLRLVHGDGVTQWSLAPSMEGTGPAYVDDDVALELDGRRVLWPGDDVRLLIGFSLDRPATWSLHLRGASSIEMNIVWSADPEAADVDEPSSRLEPVETEFEMAHDGALVGDDVDCYTFEVEAHEVLRVLMEWDLVPIELQQQSARPELILADGREAPTPEMQVVQDEERASVRYVWRALREGDTTLCLQGQADRFQAYVWAGMLSYEGIGPVDPGGFSGEGTYPEGGGQAPPAGEPMVLAEPTSGVAAVGGVALLLLGLLDFTRRTTSVLLRFGVTVPGLLLVLTAGVVHPLVAASSSVQQPGELTLEEVIDDRLAQLWDVAAPGIPESTMVLHAGATFGRLDGEVLRLRLDVTDAVPLEDGRFQLQAKGLDSLRLDEAIFGHVARAGGASSEHVQRFVLLAGRSLLLDLLMLEALLVVEDVPPNNVVHLNLAMTSTSPTGSVTAPAWGTRPSDIQSSAWSVLQNALLPERIAVSLCDCDLDLLDIRSVPADDLRASDLPRHEGVLASDGLLALPGWTLLTGIVLVAGGWTMEAKRRRHAKALAQTMFGFHSAS